MGLHLLFLLNLTAVELCVKTGNMLDLYKPDQPQQIVL